MKVSLVSAAALGLGLLLHLADTTIILGTTTTGVAVGVSALGAGVAALGAVVLGAVALAAKGGRSKREAVQCLPFDNADIYFGLAANADPLGCAQRFVCEVFAEDPANLTQEEQLIRGVFSRDLTSSTDEATPKAIFYSAAGLGAEAGAVACAEEFFKCAFDRKILLKEFIKTATKQQQE